MEGAWPISTGLQAQAGLTLPATHFEGRRRGTPTACKVRMYPCCTLLCVQGPHHTSKGAAKEPSLQPGCLGGQTSTMALLLRTASVICRGSEHSDSRDEGQHHVGA